MNFLDRQIILSIVAYPFILYAVAFVSVWINPYRYDDRIFVSYIYGSWICNAVGYSSIRFT